MGHPPRLCFDGALYHVTARGDNKESVFLDEADHQQYLMLLRRYDERRQREAYCDFVEARREPAPGEHQDTAASLAQGIVGSDAFRHHMQARFHLSVRRRGRPPRPTPGKIRV